jgi:hypothetical protein
MRECKDLDVEEALSQWYSVITGRAVCVNGPVLKSKSEELAKTGPQRFKATDGCLGGNADLG